ncbi:MAG TPA: hypothetical protein VK699_20655 [Terriglobales bacterium]|jgi:hypothetical protein|nr:hypothetical protein [Terriglobales bacterium]
MREIDKFESGPHSEDRMARALRRLAAEAPRSAPPELGAGLGSAFRRHHQRRRIRNAGVAALMIVCLSSAGWLFTRAGKKTTPEVTMHHPAPAPAVKQTAAANTAGTEKISSPGTQETKKIAKHAPRRGVQSRQQIQTAARQEDDFLPLPAYDPDVAQSELQIVRVQMPIQDLRLVGAPVGPEIPNRPVLADFVVGRDGTPYAVRLVQ